MRKAVGSGRLTEFPHDHKVLFGLWAVGGSDSLCSKFARRGNLERGCILRRPCLYQDMRPLPKAIYQAHRIRRRICLRARTNDLRLSSFSAGMFGSTLKSNLEGARYEYGRRLSPHCFRRVATHELRGDGASDARIKGA